MGAKRTVTCCEPPGAIVPDVQLAVNPSGAVMPVTESAAVPLLVIVSADSVVRPTSTLPNASVPPSDSTLLTVWAEDGAGAVLGAVGLSPPQAEAASANSRTPLRKDRTIGRSSNDRAAADGPSRMGATGPWQPGVSGRALITYEAIGGCELRV